MGETHQAADTAVSKTLTRHFDSPPACPAGRGRHSCRWLLAFVAMAASAGAQEAPSEEPSPRRGPPEIRDEQLLAQPRLTLPALSPDTLGKGRWAVTGTLQLTNTFSWVQDVPGEMPGDRRFLIDGEAGLVDLIARRGLTDDLDVGARLPVRWRGGGILDGLIDTWHRLLHLPDNARPLFRRNAFRVEGITTTGETFSWNDQAGMGLGSLELEARWRFRNGGRDGWSLALAGRVALPTATTPFDGNGLGLGLQWVAAHRLGRPFDLFLGVGGTAEGSDTVRGVGYERYRGWGFLAVEWRVAHRFRLLAESDAASRLISDIDLYPGLHWYIRGAGWLDLSPRLRGYLGFTEKVKNLLSTSDFGLQVGVVVQR